MKQILLVDDNKDYLHLFKNMLESEGISVQCAASGEDAITILETNHEFLLIITDLHMPGLDGLELCKVASRIVPEMKSFLITGDISPEIPQQAKEVGISRVFTKSFKPEEMLMAIKEITPAIQPRMPWRVANVKPLAGFRLYVRFVDGLEGEVDMSELIHSPSAGVFAQLADPLRFAEVFVKLGAVTWPGDIDVAPDTMYQGVKQERKWILH